ncbi:MAG: non-ribosomal peptide synthase/polyketide synthase [Nostoc sp.]|uniref:non-ribosomal peptide synthase/polyketide synthase n=1 Tax=Nostoc sp. TaxID=1180 RepID=UPI002FF5BBB2
MSTIVKKSYPLSSGQEAMWFLQQIAPESVAYNIFITVKINSYLNISVVELVWKKNIEKHPILRTTYISYKGKPIQQVNQQSNFGVELIDASKWSEDELKENIFAIADCPFNLEKDSVLRVNLFTRSVKEHILLLTMHHIAGDMWSFDLLLSEFQTLYAKEIEQVSLEQIEVADSLRSNKSYADFVNWQSEMLSSSRGEKQWQYWQQQLADELPILNLLPDKPRPPVQTYRGASHIIKLDEQLTQKLKHLASGTSLYQILLAAFYIQLYRYTNQTDILIGSPMRGRSGKDFKEIVGYFVNLTVLRTSVQENATFTEFLAQVSKTVREAQKHQDYPFSLLAEQLQPQRDLSRSPLCQASFTWQRHTWCEPKENLLYSQAQMLQMEPYLLGHQRGADWDLNLMVMEAQGVLQLCWQYNTDLFEATTIERMAEHFVTLLEGIVDNPQKQIWQLPLLTKVEQQRLLVEWNDTSVDYYPSDKCIHQLFEEQVALTPDAVAVVFEDEQLTYHQLNCRANSLAHYLQSLGVGTSELVGLCVERSSKTLPEASPLMIIALLAILKAGGAYVPLDPEYPSERLSFMLQDTQVKVLLTQAKLLEFLPQHQALVVCLDADWQSISVENQDNLNSTVNAENPAYVIYTSGSTGTPKGVVVNHQAVNRLVLTTNYIQLTADDRIAQAANIAFDAATFEIWGALLNGAMLVIITKSVLLSPQKFADSLQEYEVSVLFLTTALFNQLASLVPQAFSSLKYLLFGGEAVDPRWVQEVLDKGAPRYLLHVYGPTENTTFSTWYLVENLATTGTTIPIGRAIANTQTYILDRNLQPVPVGVVGELYLGGVGLAQGYLNRPELTNERFISSPFDNSKLYKTGDLARYLPDGNIEYIDRVDNQVKIRGFRIELGEIETVLGQHPQINSVVAIAREDIPGNKRIVAYIVPQPQQKSTISELRTLLKSKLPEYMIPSAIVILESLPLTPNGKIDRRALPAPDLDSTLVEQYVAPRTPIEELLAQIWTQVLKVEQVGIYDNFFELGGQSLLATQLVSRVRNVFQVELPLNRLFTAATVAQLATVIEQLQPQKGELSTEPISRRAENAELPLSYAQQRLWFIDQFQPNSALYNIPIALRLAGTLEVTVLEQSLIEIIARHEALRTNFITVDGQASQIIQTLTNWTISVVDLQHLSTSEKEIAAQQLVQQQALQPFDLATDTLVRATLLVLSETEHTLLVCMHHIVSDGWSMDVFVQELASLYNAYSQGQESPLAPLPIQYADFAIWQRDWLQGDVLQSQLNYWEQQLADAPALLSLPTDRPRPTVQRFVGAHQKFALSVELTDRLTKLSQQQGVTLFMTVLAAFDTLLYRYTGTEDILVGTPIANRNRSEIEGLIGFFVNTLVIRTDVLGDRTFNELLVRIREACLGAYAHQDLPFEMLVEALQPQRDLSHSPLFQVMFALQNAPIAQLDLAGLSVSSLPIERGSAKFDLTLFMDNTATGLVGEWEYNTDLFDPSTIERMTGHFVTLLEAIVTNPSQPIAQLPLLTQVEQQQLLVEWNNNQADYPSDKCIHQLFEEQVHRTPDAVVVVFENQQLTYDELNCRANQLANYLQTLGVQPDTLVGICVERSLEMVVGLLGILKAGGAYVPLDPDYPQDRLSFMLEDAQVSVLLTQQQFVEKLYTTSLHQARVICLDTDWNKIAQNSLSNLQNTATPGNLAYVIYTSGSTGKPKGVLVNHFNVTRLFTATDSWYHFNQDDVWTMFHSYAFDFSVWEIWGALLYGGRLVVVPYLVTRSPQSFYQLLYTEKVTVLNQTPSAFRQLIQAEQSITTTDDLNLRLVIFGGEALELSSLQPWFERHSDTLPQLVNMYGITETTVHVTYRPLNKADLQSAASIIGRPIPDLQVYVLDEHQKPVPIGIGGEMYVGGEGVARGYLNRPDLTQQRFISHPFSNNPQARLYKTGDKARYLANGELEYLGRIDNQVKIRGFRIELGEIETLLASHPQVWESVVVVREDEPEDKRLVAYLVKSDESLTTNQLRSFLKAKLPEYMIPSALVMLPSLPLTANGKVDRRALPKPDLDGTLLEKYVAPRTPTEEILTQIWVQVLKVEQVGIQDNFFELGGHSLLATQLVSRIRNIFKVELPLRELFATATVAELAQSIGQLQQQNLELYKPPIFKRAENTELPLSYAQQRLWFLDQLQPNSSFYNIPIALRILSKLNQSALEQSFIEIINRHEALRTNFIAIDGQPTQVIREKVTDRGQGIVSVVELRHLPANEQEITAQRLAQQQATQPFDLAQGALVRATLIILSETEHILLLCMHHIVSDGWSIGVLIEELAALYNAYAQGQSSPLSPLPVQYADFALWQRQWLQGNVLQSQLSYWQQQLANAPTLLPLPTDRPRPAVQTFSGAYQQFPLPTELTNRLVKLSQEQGVTLFMTLLAAFDTLLYRYTGQEDILVGSPIANRDRSEVEGLIGFFVNTLVMRTDLTGNPSFSQLLARVRDMAMQAYTHQDLPFEMLLEALQPERNLGHTPLFQVMFSLQNTSISELELTELTVNQLKVEGITAKFDLTLLMQKTSTGLVGIWEYNTDLFDASTIERMTGHFVTLLEGIIANPDEQISQLPLLTLSEQQQLLVEWNDTSVDYSIDRCIHQLFEEQVARTPDAIAVTFGNQQLTYQQLNAQANQLAHYLKSLGVKADVLVGICLERSLDMIVGILGILKAGGAYVSLDPEYPHERLSFMLEDAQLRVLLTQQRLVETLHTTSLHQARVVCLDTDWEKIAQNSLSNPQNTATAENLAYVIYTSGSTGKPKGVLVNHSNVVRLFTATDAWYKFNQDDVWTMFHSYAFDFSIWEIWGAFLYGGRLVVVPYLVTRSPESFYQLLCQEKVTVLNQTPSAFRQLIQAEQSIGTTNDLSLRLVIFGGEALELSSLQPWFERHGDTLPQLVNMYGITETTVHVTYRPLSKADLHDTASVIGRPIPDLQVYLLDQNLQPVPIGVPGEMYVSGAGVTRGYLNRPELTQQRFISNPFVEAQGNRLYRTGDSARYLPNGELEYLGRIDNQVKIRGFRIELGEIEGLLASHPAVWENVVMVREDEPGDKRLVAYVVPKAEQSTTVQELREFLGNQLPSYMIPNAFVLLKSLPLTANGKIDRRALPKPDLDSTQLEKFVAPRTPIEEMLVQIWAQVLKLEQVGIHDNFFELGGHSLLATQLVSRIRNLFKVELPLRELFSNATVAQLARSLQHLQQQDITLTAPPILKRVENVELPLSFAQQRLWFLDQFEPNRPFYNIPIALRLAGTLNQAALQQSLQAIIVRHEALRTNFITIDGQASQIIQTSTDWQVWVVDLQHLSTTEQEITVQQLAQEHAIQPFDLANQALVRAKLLVLSETEHMLLVCMHHIVSDGWSMGLFVKELATLYGAYAQGKSPNLAPLPIQYADFALWQRQWLQGNVLQSQLNYWQEQLKDAPALLSLPTDRPRPAVQTFAGAHHEFAISLEVSQKLIQLSQQQGCTLFMTLLAAYDTLLYRYTQQEDILVGTPIANRDRSQIEGLIGFFVNTLVMRTNLAGNPSFSELLGRVREMAMEAYTHQNLPFEMLVEALQPERNLSHSPLFQVMFVLENAPVSQLELTGLTVNPLKVKSTTAKFDLTLGMENTANGLMGVWEYNTDLFDSNTMIARMVGHFVTLLEAIAANPQQRISQLPLLTQPEQHQLLVEWNNTQTDYRQNQCIHKLFESQAQRNPDAVAVVFGNQQLTYQQLNTQANQLAHHLRSLGVGVGVDVLVGICVERSLDMIVGILGILKAGGAYVPLDPEYPQDRLSFMLEDAQVKVLLTQQQLIQLLPQHQARIVCLDTDWEKIAQNSLSNPQNIATSENLAYVIYTSGSTGKPKGVLVNHSNVVRLFAATDAWYQFNQDDVWTMFHSYAFDFSVWEIWGALLYGGRLVIVPYLVTRSPESFYQLLCQEKVTVLNQTPSAFRQLIQAEQSIGTANDLSLRLVIFGGEALELKSLQPWFERHGDSSPQLVNMYGITETTVHVTYRPLSKADLHGAASVIGCPIPDLQVYLLDQNLQPVPIGVPGEMYVGGAGVTRGYLNRPELTEQRFISNSFVEAQGSRLYRTGDLARYLPNGDLEYLGRIDNQVKIRGFRIELGEIEGLLASHPAVWENVVVVREDKPGDKRLVAYVVSKAEQSLTAAQLRRFLTNQLPSYMLPSAFVELKALPLTANGKLDRRALPIPDTARPELENVFVAPSTKEEKILAAIWTQVLGVEQVGINDNFFALGGDSIRSIQVLSKAKEKGLSFSLAELFQYQTIHELVQELKNKKHDITKSELTQPFSLICEADKQKLPDGVEDAYPLAMLQMGMLFHSEYATDSAVYREISSFHLKTPLNVELLEVAIQDLVNHHAVLRTSFELSNFSIPLQLVHRQVKVPLQVEDWCHLNHSQQEDALTAWFEVEKKQHFDWTQPSLLRFFVHRRTPETFNLTLSCHHAILDGWSVSLMMTELFSRYLSLLGEQIDYISPPLSITFRDYLALEQQAIASSETQHYWREKLNDSTFTQLPQWESVPTDTINVGLQDITLSSEIYEGLKKFAQSAEVPLKSVLLAAHLRVLNLLSGQSDVLTGLIANGRPEQSDGERVLGLFLNTLPLRLQLTGGTWMDLVQQVFAAEREMLPHRRYPLAEIQRNLGQRSLGGEPLFETAFNFVHFHVYQQVLELDNLQLLGGKSFEETNFTFVASFSVNPISSQAELQIEYDVLKFTPQQINRIGEYYLNTLAAIVNQPQGRYELQSLLSQKEQQQLLVEWNDTQADYPRDKCLHQLFEQQAQLTPDAVAVVFDNEQLTYQQLNTQANQLAHDLQSLGVEPEVLVGIYLERSLSIIVTLLAVLKAGGGYVPLDPDYPQQRLADISQDSQVSVLITQEKLLDSLPVSGVKVIVLDAEFETLTTQSTENLVSTVKPENIACLLYTSGSTGKPKGVMLTHAALVNHSSAISEIFGLTSSDRVLQFASFGFDVAAEEIYPTWYKGGTVVVRPVQMFPDFANLAQFIEQQKLTVLNITPAYWHEWTVAVSQQDATVPECLRLVAVGGDAVLPETVTMWRELVGDGITCLNVYGPTEASVTAVVHDLLHPESGKTNTVLIGRPIANTQIYILDQNLQPVPVGIKGDLHIGGVRLARGYFNRSELTQEKFLPNQFRDPKVDRIYKTGDLARYLPNGNIECFGRIDNQVKIRGFRIELGEIEAVLNQHPDVQTSCVILREDTPGDKRLVAYVVLYSQEIPAVSELRQFLSNRLPLYMVPSTFVTLESLPLTAHRKVDRRALPTPDLQSEQIDNYVAPRTPCEEMLAQIWAQVLKLEQVGIHDNFFELGGHSLLATQLVSRICSIFKIELPLRSIFAAATVAALAELIEQLQPQQGEFTSAPILPRAKDAELLLSFAQQRLWFLEQLQPNTALYNIPEALRLVGTLNQAALEQSLQEIIARHEALRTNFIAVDGQARQIIQTQIDWQISVVDLQHLPANEQEITVQQLAQEQALQPFDLAKGALIKAKLLVLPETEHILLIAMHHIVSDDWSMGVFVSELTALYNAYAQNQPSPLPRLPIQYADFALWQRQWLQGDVLQGQLNYWQEQLKDAPALLPLPTDRPRPALQTFAGAYQKFELSPQLTEKLTQLSQQQGATLFMTLLAAYNTLLYRYTGVADVLVGTPIANRDRSEIEGLIGFFANTLVMRTDLSANPNFCELLGRVREVALQAYAHQNLPFEMLVEALQPERNLSHTPLFQVAFILQNAPTSQLEMTGLTLGHVSTAGVTAKFDLTLAMGSTDTGLVGVWEYNTDLFDAGTIEQMADHFVTLLEAIVANPQERISQLPLLTAVEQQQLLIDWNDTSVDYPTDKCIHQLFEEQVARSPYAVAVVFENEQLTYHQLNCRANSLAHYLRSLGVQADVLVGLFVERSLEMLVAVLGILKAGGAYVPLDPQYPQERLQFMLEDAQLGVLLTQKQLVNKLPQNQARLVCLDEIESQIDENNQESLTGVVTAAHLANVIYTSGSTGKPKGVMVKHTGFVNLSQAQIQTFGVNSSSRILQFASLSFDASIWEIIMALGSGATLYLGTKDSLAPGTPLLERLRDYGITHVTLPPSALFVLPAEELPALQTIIVAGEACSGELIKQWSVGRNFFNAYGPTETTVCATIAKCHPEDEKISIGRPIANTQIYILDSHLQPVPIGVPGELHIGGVGLAKGYLNRAELTQEKFIPNPFNNSKFYKTGDLARYLPDGNIKYLGRVDNQVKIRGFRIESGEIEAVLNQHPDVQTNCVILREDSSGDKRLVAYVVPYSQQIPTTSEMRQFISNHLPHYMMPQAFVILESLPLTPNGKIDRRALPTPDLHSEQKDYVAPRTPTEEMVAQIWAQVLKLEQVGIEDNFFTLGGHSLLATQVISRLQSALGILLPLRSLFESPTVAQLSEIISSQLETGLALAVPTIAPVSRDADIPLSWAQERLWFVNQLEGESGAYTIDLTIRLRGNLDVLALEQAFAAIIQRHEPLRTQFKLKNNQPVQVIEPNGTFTLPAVDLQNVADPSKQVVQLAKEEVCKPFDLANGCVLRVKLWQVATDEYVLVLAIHHIAADGWSMGVLTNELSAYYQAIATSSPVTLPELPIQYADFAVWQRQWLTNEVLDRQLSYWKQQLTGALPLLELPTDRPRPAIQTFRGGTEQLQLNVKLTQQLKKLSQESGTTLFMTLLAGFTVLMSRYSGQKDLIIGSPIANRNRTEIEGLIGFFVNTLALRFDLSQEPTFKALLAQVRRVTQEAYDHQDLPFEMLVEELQVERNLDRNPLVQVVFALQNAPSAPLELPGLTVEGMASGLDSVRLDLEFYLWDTPEGLGGFCSYNSDLFDAVTIARMMQHFVTLLEAIVDRPQQPVALLPLLTQPERHQLLLEWNNTSVDYPQDRCIHQLFEEQSLSTLDAVAVVFGNEQLTYHQLNCRANRLAHYLQSLGVRADVLVGICVERSLSMVIGLLAILKAGGAYVPLDPEYPSDRLGFMLQDTQVKVLLTQERLLEKLPQHQAKLVFLDDIEPQIDNSQGNPTGVVTASHLANVIYTSGSTGKPKGVMVEHRGLYNLALAQIQAFGVDSKSRVLQFASFSFDACISEILMSLGSGATLYLGTKDAIMPGTPLVESLRNYGITHVTLPPSALAVLPNEEFPNLQTIVVAGEAFSPELVKLWSVGRNFFNAYGPTEASVCATIAKCNLEDEKVSIGRPIANVQVYILDSQLQPVPVGVPGELHIGGVGLARGYLNRPELTTEKFIPHPFSDEPDARLYKTGDLARYLPDGNIEYLGRIDNQVKIRGFRIELGEIEDVLTQHPLVQEGVVVAKADNTGDKQLVAYLVPALKNKVLPQQLAQWQSEYVSDWQMLYEQAYGQPQTSTDDLTFNISGWNSSYTKQAIPDWEMREWVENTVSRILSLSPQRVLEIGCGTGLLLSRVAPKSQEYWGIDYSSAALQHVEQMCKTLPGLDNVRLLQRTADNFDGIPQGEFDTVVINSVVQYFPSVEYLLQVIESAIATMTQKGKLFLGDIRSLPLLEPFHAAVQLSQAAEDRTIEQWQQQVNSSVAAEEELAIDPSFFIALQTRFPQITWVEIQPKRGYAQNELTQFRYDVTLHIGADIQTQLVPWLNWQLEKLSFTQIQHQLQQQPQILGIRGVPNQRVQQALQIWQCLENPPAVETVGQLRELLTQQPTVGINPEEFYQLGQQNGYTVHISWWGGSQDGSFDVVFYRKRGQKATFWDNSSITVKPCTDYTNNALYGKLVQKLVPQVRSLLQQKLPNYMLPQAFILLKALPLTPNGKVDRRALPAPDTATRNLGTNFVSPRTPVEAQLVQIWCEVLGLARIGVKDNFFELGGHSLLATQVVLRINSTFKLDLSVKMIFESPTVAATASYIQAVNWAAKDLAVLDMSSEVVEF